MSKDRKKTVANSFPFLSTKFIATQKVSVAWQTLRHQWPGSLKLLVKESKSEKCKLALLKSTIVPIQLGRLYSGIALLIVD